jgi:hypothetical protein
MISQLTLRGHGWMSHRLPVEKMSPGCRRFLFRRSRMRPTGRPVWRAGNPYPSTTFRAGFLAKGARNGAPCHVRGRGIEGLRALPEARDRSTAHHLRVREADASLSMTTVEGVVPPTTQGVCRLRNERRRLKRVLRALSPLRCRIALSDCDGICEDAIDVR